VERRLRSVGERVLSRFTISERLGSGGFGTVYRGWDEKLQRPVAVKVIDDDNGGGRVLRRPRRRAPRPSQHRPLYELAHEGSRAFLVTELVEGNTLRRLSRAGCSASATSRRSAPTPPRRSPTRTPKGWSTATSSPRTSSSPTRRPREARRLRHRPILDEQTMTATGDVLGTLAYMAPEQADGERPGPESDVYSLR